MVRQILCDNDEYCGDKTLKKSNVHVRIRTVFKGIRYTSPTPSVLFSPAIFVPAPEFKESVPCE